MRKIANRWEWFWGRVDDSGDHWLWKGALRPDGYGRADRYDPATRKNLNCYAHRYAWELYYGPIPTGWDVLHHCDIRACVHPLHLFLGTDSDNQADSGAKGRHGRQRHPEQCWTTKLTAEQARLIREARATERTPRKELAARFGVSESAIKKVLAQVTWRHV